MEKSVYSQICPNLETITLYDLNYQAIIQDLSKFILVKCEGGDITILDATKESSYYILDLFRSHVLSEDAPDPKPEHVCSTLVARILRNGLGVEKYTTSVAISKQKLGHEYAYPELISEIASSAALFEEQNAKIEENKRSPQV